MGLFYFRLVRTIPSVDPVKKIELNFVNFLFQSDWTLFFRGTTMSSKHRDEIGKIKIMVKG